MPGGGHAGPCWGRVGPRGLQSSELQRRPCPPGGSGGHQEGLRAAGWVSGWVGSIWGTWKRPGNQLRLALSGGSSAGSRGARCGGGQGGTSRKRGTKGRLAHQRGDHGVLRHPRPPIFLGYRGAGGCREARVRGRGCGAPRGASRGLRALCGTGSPGGRGAGSPEQALGGETFRRDWVRSVR